MASEQMVLNLKEEKLRLEEQAIAAEEAVLAAQEESDAKDTQLMDAREAQMKAEIKAEQLMQRLEAMDSKSLDVQTKFEEVTAKYKEAHSEVVALEEEKYQLTEDVETLEEELEEAHNQTKRYYEVVEEREAELRKLRDELKGAKQRQERLAYEKELAELQNNPVEEGGNDTLEDVYATIDKQKEALAAKERTIAKLTSELDGYKYTVDEEPPARGRLSLRSQAASNQADDSDDFGTVQAQQKLAADKKVADDVAKTKRAEHEAAKAKQLTEQMQRRAEAAEVQLAEANRRLQSADRDVAAKEAEVLKLIQQRDNVGGGSGGKDVSAYQERESELEEEMAYLNQQLEDEQQAREELERELQALRGSGSPQDVQTLRLELEDMRIAKERAEAMLARALPG